MQPFMATPWRGWNAFLLIRSSNLRYARRAPDIRILRSPHASGDRKLWERSSLMKGFTGWGGGVIFLARAWFQVALVYPNNDPVAFVCSLYGCFMAGLVPVPIEVPLTRRVSGSGARFCGGLVPTLRQTSLQWNAAQTTLRDRWKFMELKSVYHEPKSVFWMMTYGLKWHLKAFLPLSRGSGVFTAQFLQCSP